MLVLGATFAIACAHARADQFWSATGDGVLASMRGGFALPDGLMVSFGIVRTVTIDGQVVSQTALNIPDLRNITVEQARQLGASGLQIVQNGPGNIVQLPRGAMLPGLVVQNSESNRRLQALTEITAGTNTMRALQGMNLDQTLSDALKGAVGR